MERSSLEEVVILPGDGLQKQQSVRSVADNFQYVQRPETIVLVVF